MLDSGWDASLGQIGQLLEERVRARRTRRRFPPDREHFLELVDYQYRVERSVVRAPVSRALAVEVLP
ncbi:MAG: hypothetical protein IPJ56_02665 [Gemmatimonadetes bacterium]|nr:hypothetical protein [Gemmatimonadota bacterium]